MLTLTWTWIVVLAQGSTIFTHISSSFTTKDTKIWLVMQTYHRFPLARPTPPSLAILHY
jgi:hypothetical protein